MAYPARRDGMHMQQAIRDIQKHIDRSLGKIEKRGVLGVSAPNTKYTAVAILVPRQLSLVTFIYLTRHSRYYDRDSSFQEGSGVSDPIYQERNCES
jgi:hypothetical protein